MEINSTQPIPTDKPEAADGYKKISASIVIGCLMVSGSIVYTGSQILRSLSGGQPTVAAQVKGTTTPTAPAVPQNVNVRGDAASLGNKNAKVTVVEFADFQCPFCQKFYKETFPQIKSKYIDTNKIRYVFMHYPLSFHVNAEISSVAAECANQQGKFLEYHNQLFDNGKADGTGLALADLKKYGQTLGLGSKFEQCLDTKATLQTVQSDFSEGGKAGVTGTPSFFINGVKLVGSQPFVTFEAAIEAALK